MTDTQRPTECPFCDYAGPSTVLASYAHSFVIEPINPCTEGHVLVIPREHTPDAVAAPELSAWVFRDALAYSIEAAVGDCNFIVNDGALAGQTVKHLHMHIVPRRAGDGLALPWVTKDLCGNCGCSLTEFHHWFNSLGSCWLDPKVDEEAVS